MVIECIFITMLLLKFYSPNEYKWNSVSFLIWSAAFCTQIRPVFLCLIQFEDILNNQLLSVIILHKSFLLTIKKKSKFPFFLLFSFLKMNQSNQNVIIK